VVESDGPTVRRLREKPRYSFLVNAGIYLLDPAAHSCIPSDRRFDMTDLIERLLEEGRTVVSFPIVEYWLDIGEPVDYEQAQADVRDGRIEIEVE
jgi:NDP-sugar pyrophosphorylase family protein